MVGKRNGAKQAGHSVQPFHIRLRCKGRVFGKVVRFVLECEAQVGNSCFVFRGDLTNRHGVISPKMRVSLWKRACFSVDGYYFLWCNPCFFGLLEVKAQSSGAICPPPCWPQASLLFEQTFHSANFHLNICILQSILESAREAGRGTGKILHARHHQEAPEGSG